ncbi:hypothetical protein WA158_008224 [Blastocystis sp. Blastoise]
MQLCEKILIDFFRKVKDPFFNLEIFNKQCIEKFSSSKDISLFFSVDPPLKHFCSTFISVGETAYQCSTCTSVPSAHICEHCWNPEQHINHKYKKVVNQQEGNSCDCGIILVNPEVMCTYHKSIYLDLKQEQENSEEILEYYKHYIISCVFELYYYIKVSKDPFRDQKSIAIINSILVLMDSSISLAQYIIHLFTETISFPSLLFIRQTPFNDEMIFITNLIRQVPYLFMVLLLTFNCKNINYQYTLIQFFFVLFRNISFIDLVNILFPVILYFYSLDLDKETYIDMSSPESLFQNRFFSFALFFSLFTTNQNKMLVFDIYNSIQIPYIKEIHEIMYKTEDMNENLFQFLSIKTYIICQIHNLLLIKKNKYIPKNTPLCSYLFSLLIQSYNDIFLMNQSLINKSSSFPIYILNYCSLIESLTFLDISTKECFFYSLLQSNIPTEIFYQNIRTFISLLLKDIDGFISKSNEEQCKKLFYSLFNYTKQCISINTINDIFKSIDFNQYHLYLSICLLSRSLTGIMNCFPKISLDIDFNYILYIYCICIRQFILIKYLYNYDDNIHSLSNYKGLYIDNLYYDILSILDHYGMFIQTSLSLIPFSDPITILFWFIYKGCILLEENEYYNTSEQLINTIEQSIQLFDIQNISIDIFPFDSINLSFILHLLLCIQCDRLYSLDHNLILCNKSVLSLLDENSPFDNINLVSLLNNKVTIPVPVAPSVNNILTYKPLKTTKSEYNKMISDYDKVSETNIYIFQLLFCDPTFCYNFLSKDNDDNQTYIPKRNSLSKYISKHSSYYHFLFNCLQEWTNYISDPSLLLLLLHATYIYLINETSNYDNSVLETILGFIQSIEIIEMPNYLSQFIHFLIDFIQSLLRNEEIINGIEPSNNNDTKMDSCITKYDDSLICSICKQHEGGFFILPIYLNIDNRRYNQSYQSIIERIIKNNENPISSINSFRTIYQALFYATHFDITFEEHHQYCIQSCNHPVHYNCLFKINSSLDINRVDTHIYTCPQCNSLYNMYIPIFDDQDCYYDLTPESVKELFSQYIPIVDKILNSSNFLSSFSNDIDQKPLSQLTVEKLILYMQQFAYFNVETMHDNIRFNFLSNTVPSIEYSIRNKEQDSILSLQDQRLLLTIRNMFIFYIKAFKQYFYLPSHQCIIGQCPQFYVYSTDMNALVNGLILHWNHYIDIIQPISYNSTFELFCESSISIHKSLIADLLRNYFLWNDYHLYNKEKEKENIEKDRSILYVDENEVSFPYINIPIDDYYNYEYQEYITILKSLYDYPLYKSDRHRDNNMNHYLFIKEDIPSLFNVKFGYIFERYKHRFIYIMNCRTKIYTPVFSKEKVIPYDNFDSISIPELEIKVNDIHTYKNKYDIKTINIETTQEFIDQVINTYGTDCIPSIDNIITLMDILYIYYEDITINHSISNCHLIYSILSSIILYVSTFYSHYTYQYPVSSESSRIYSLFKTISYHQIFKYCYIMEDLLLFKPLLTQMTQNYMSIFSKESLYNILFNEDINSSLNIKTNSKQNISNINNNNNILTTNSIFVMNKSTFNASFIDITSQDYYYFIYFCLINSIYLEASKFCVLNDPETVYNHDYPILWNNINCIQESNDTSKNTINNDIKKNNNNGKNNRIHSESNNNINIRSSSIYDTCKNIFSSFLNLPTDYDDNNENTMNNNNNENTNNVKPVLFSSSSPPLNPLNNNFFIQLQQVYTSKLPCIIPKGIQILHNQSKNCYVYENDESHIVGIDLDRLKKDVIYLDNKDFPNEKVYCFDSINHNIIISNLNLICELYNINHTYNGVKNLLIQFFINKITFKDFLNNLSFDTLYVDYIYRTLADYFILDDFFASYLHRQLYECIKENGYSYMAMTTQQSIIHEKVNIQKNMHTIIQHYLFIESKSIFPSYTDKEREQYVHQFAIFTPKNGIEAFINYLYDFFPLGKEEEMTSLVYSNFIYQYPLFFDLHRKVLLLQLYFLILQKEELHCLIEDIMNNKIENNFINSSLNVLKAYKNSQFLCFKEVSFEKEITKMLLEKGIEYTLEQLSIPYLRSLYMFYLLLNPTFQVKEPILIPSSYSELFTLLRLNESSSILETEKPSIPWIELYTVCSKTFLEVRNFCNGYFILDFDLYSNNQDYYFMDYLLNISTIKRKQLYTSTPCSICDFLNQNNMLVCLSCGETICASSKSDSISYIYNDIIYYYGNSRYRIMIGNLNQLEKSPLLSYISKEQLEQNSSSLLSLFITHLKQFLNDNNINKYPQLISLLEYFD